MKNLAPYFFSLMFLLLCQTAQSQTDTTKKEVFEFVEQMPEFPQGEDSMVNFIVNHLKYPKNAQNAELEGRVIINFTVNQFGKLIDIKCVRNEFKCPKYKKLESLQVEQKALIDEAIRVISKMPKWKPGFQQGKAVQVKFALPLTFTLE